jgi:riboflavin biosynthesis pyrimidine reductase
VPERPYVLLSCAVSVDGCLDAPGPDRLILSGSDDLDRVDGERARCDAIMVGAGTIRRDNPRLLIRAAPRRAARVAGGLPEHPAGVTITASGRLDPAAAFFTAARPAARGGSQRPADPGSAVRGTAAERRVPPQRLVYCASPAVPALRERLGGLAEVVDAGEPVLLAGVLAGLARRGVRRLMAEGGASLGSQLLAAGLVDELQLVVAPFFVGDPRAPRFAPPGSYPRGPAHPMALAEVRRLGEVVLLRYLRGRNGEPGRAPLAGDAGRG